MQTHSPWPAAFGPPSAEPVALAICKFSYVRVIDGAVRSRQRLTAATISDPAADLHRPVRWLATSCAAEALERQNYWALCARAVAMRDIETASAAAVDRVSTPQVQSQREARWRSALADRSRVSRLRIVSTPATQTMHPGAIRDSYEGAGKNAEKERPKAATSVASRSDRTCAGSAPISP